MKTASDVFKLALQHEVKAATFYYRAAEISQNDESRMVLLDLNSMEEGHAQELVNRVKGAPCSQEFDAMAYLTELENSMAASISPEEDRILKTGDMRSVLELAIRLETVGWDNYLSFAEKAANSEIKKYLLDLAAEEEDHISRLTQLLNSLDMDAEERPGL